MKTSTLTPELKAYIKQHATSTKRSGIYIVHTPMYVFKKVHVFSNSWRHRLSPAIANMVIPSGAMIHVPEAQTYLPIGIYKDSFSSDDDRYAMKPIRSLYGKFRASEAQIHSIVRISAKTHHTYGYSQHDPNFRYEVGQTVVPLRKFANTDVECASGIHFFVDLKQAIRY